MEDGSFVNFPSFELVSQSIDLWPCIIEHCEARTLFSLLGVSSQLAGMVRTELRARFALASKAALAPSVSLDVLWFLLETTGGGVVGRHALSVWNNTAVLPLGSLELSLPLGQLSPTEAWFISRGYFNTPMHVSSDRADVIKSSSRLVNGTSQVVLLESRNASPFTPLLEGQPTLLMNILTSSSWFVLYPNATFDRRGMWGTGLPDVVFEENAASSGYDMDAEGLDPLIPLPLGTTVIDAEVAPVGGELVFDDFALTRIWLDDGVPVTAQICLRMKDGRRNFVQPLATLRPSAWLDLLVQLLFGVHLTRGGTSERSFIATCEPDWAFKKAAHLSRQIRANMQVQSAMARFFEKPDVHYMVLELLSIHELRVYGLVCERTYEAVKHYLRKNARLTRLLSPFIDVKHISSFRRMQRATGAIVGGSAALQFFTRQAYQSSDLDLYVHVTYVGKVCCALKKMRCIKVPKGIPGTNVASIHPAYAGRSIKEVIDFVTTSNRKIQVIVTLRRPVDVILNYHSTTVMNFITGWYAYTLYAKETLQLGVAVYNPNASHLPAIKAKWTLRGWAEVSSPADALAMDAFQVTSRTVGDESTCIVKLSSKGTEGDAKYRDTAVREASWMAGFNNNGVPYFFSL
ncbi:hypothetical protein EYR36_002301 [Pleurotus pulmonarius]|nr:hypothetical protein EYR36_002301 [Pleurotus pulmonarius]